MRAFSLSEQSLSVTHLQRVVVTSSYASVNNPSSTGVLDENSRNDENIGGVKRLGPKASQVVKYRASKVLAEKGPS